MTVPPKIKIIVKPTGGGVVPARKKEEAPPTTQPTKQKKGLIRKIVEIVSSDIRHLPNRIWGERKKEIKMPDSKESWKDWEGEL